MKWGRTHTHTHRGTQSLNNTLLAQTHHTRSTAEWEKCWTIMHCRRPPILSEGPSYFECVCVCVFRLSPSISKIIFIERKRKIVCLYRLVVRDLHINHLLSHQAHVITGFLKKVALLKIHSSVLFTTSVFSSCLILKNKGRAVLEREPQQSHELWAALGNRGKEKNPFDRKKSPIEPASGRGGHW